MQHAPLTYGTVLERQKKSKKDKKLNAALKKGVRWGDFLIVFGKVGKAKKSGKRK